MKDLTVVVVGAGPVGLLTTLRLAQAGIRTTCVDLLTQVDESPRAMAYHPIAVKELDRAGVLDNCRRLGSAGRGICWRSTKTKEEIASLDREPSKDFPYENLTIGQHLLAKILLDHLKRYDEATVLFSSKVTSQDQSDGKNVKLTVQHANGTTTILKADYCVAADGSRSTMRHLLSIPFEGFTYPEQLVSTNVYFDFAAHGWHDGNFMVDPEHWALIGRINNQGLWRVSYGEKSGLTHAEIQERMPLKFEEMFPKSGKGQGPPAYQLDQMSSYRIHQRCASTFRHGRVLLAGDAAHLCNPFGGLGLTTGILDAAAVADALVGIHRAQARADEILDKYAQVRRAIFVDTVDPTSQANKLRLHDNDPETLADRDPVLSKIKNATPAEMQQIRANTSLAVDMTEFYGSPPRVNGARSEGKVRSVVKSVLHQR